LQNDRPSRRKFFGDCAVAVAAVGVGAAMSCEREADRPEAMAPGTHHDPGEWWTEGKYVVHRTVDASRLNDGLLRARIDGSWRDVSVVSLPDRFVRWSFEERIARLEKLAAVGFDTRDLDGPHNACVATYGGWSRDSAFSLNTAYKGMGFMPTEERLSTTLDELAQESMRIRSASRGDFMADMLEKTQFLAGFYKDASRFDMTRQVSLELFTEPGYVTHTFLNMMANPIVSASFLAYPTFEIRAVPQLLHPGNPALTSHERDVIRYTNAIHDFVHGGTGDRMTCVYHICEVFDDTPNKGGAGTRLV
jgi:hypothetical protein